MDFTSLLSNWNGEITVNDEYVSNLNGIDTTKPIIIRLIPKAVIKTVDEQIAPISAYNMQIGKTYRITVKQYMTKQATPSFDFMEKYNKDVPMPLRVMTGELLKETKGMAYMRLHGDIWAKRICTCMCCGRQLTNPISQYFGIGPECGGHNYINPFDSDEELQNAVAEYKAKLRNIVWEGWVIKSAITDCVGVENE